MNRKHYDMVDAWVKKHYGDLERGVLSNEVQYKVLFKIYKKKYKKEKALRKHLEKRAEGPDTDKKCFPWKMDSTPSLTASRNTCVRHARSADTIRRVRMA